MSKHGKKYFNALKKAPKKPVSLEEAVKFIKENPGAKFDETVDVYFHLGTELTKGDTAVRGTVKLPNGSGKTVKIAVFAGGDAAEAARNRKMKRNSSTLLARAGRSKIYGTAPARKKERRKYAPNNGRSHLRGEKLLLPARIPAHISIVWKRITIIAMGRR